MKLDVKARTAAEVLVDQLVIQGVRHVFCVPGESYLPVLDALYDRDIAVTVCRQEGGAAIMAADKAELHGVPMPQPSDAVRTILEANVPDFGSARNPCDVTGQVLYNPESMPNCSDALLSDPAYGALIVPQTLVYEVYKARAASLSEQATRHAGLAF